MTDDREKFDKLTCGNCGYDGGEAHLKEKLALHQEHSAHQLEWQKRLAKAEELSDNARTSRHTAVTISVLFLSVAAVIAYWLSRPLVTQPAPIPPNPIVVQLQSVKSMYETCVTQAAQMNKEEKFSGMNECNKTFKTEFSKIDISETK